MKNQTALITGASSGIGYELAKIMAWKGFNLVLVARQADKLNALKKNLEEKCKVNIHVMVKDLSLPQAPNEIFSDLKEKSIQIDILVNNAGFGDYGKFAETNWEKEKMMIDLNMRSLTEMT